MTGYDYLIIGGGIAGTTAAETIRENDEKGTIAILSEEPHPLYSRVLLPSYLKGRVSREQLFLRRAEDMADKRIDLILGEKALFIDLKKQEAGLANGSSVGFKKLLIASGGIPSAWGKEDIKNFIFRLQTIDDVDRLKESMESIKKPLVIGASFISLEFLEIFVQNNIVPQVLVRGPHFMDKIFDGQGGEILRDNFDRHGVVLQTNDSVRDTSVRENEIAVLTESVRRMSCDAFALGIGIDRNIYFLEGSGIELGSKGVLTNEFLETNTEGVFAAGDVAEVYDVISGRRKAAGNWTSAFLQGKTAGLNMTGRRKEFRRVATYSITNFGLQITALGNQDEFTETIVRVDINKSQYERFFLKDDCLLGAALINRFQDKAHISKLIESKTAVGQYRDSLADWGFDVHSIPVIT